MLRWHTAIAAEGPGARVPFGNAKGEHRRLAETIPEPLLAYLRAAPHVLEVPQYNVLVVHAGLDPDRPLAEQNTYDLMHMRNVGPDGSPTEG